MDCFSKPYALSLAISESWSNQSSALEKSVKTAPISPVLLRLLKDPQLDLENTTVWENGFDCALLSHKFYLDRRNTYLVMVLFVRNSVSFFL